MGRLSEVGVFLAEEGADERQPSFEHAFADTSDTFENGLTLIADGDSDLIDFDVMAEGYVLGRDALAIHCEAVVMLNGSTVAFFSFETVFPVVDVVAYFLTQLLGDELDGLYLEFFVSEKELIEDELVSFDCVSCHVVFVFVAWKLKMRVFFVEMGSDSFSEILDEFCDELLGEGKLESGQPSDGAIVEVVLVLLVGNFFAESQRADHEALV
jgi:hypothetical protein